MGKGKPRFLLAWVLALSLLVACGSTPDLVSSTSEQVANTMAYEDAGANSVADAVVMCIIRAMPTIDSDGCRPPIPGHADHQFRRMASSFSWTPESVVALLRNQWTACSGILRSTSDPIGSGAG